MKYLWIFKAFALVFFGIKFASPCIAADRFKTTKECNVLTSRYAANSKDVFAARHARALARYVAKCASTGYFDVVLSGLYREAGMADDADIAARAGLIVNNDFRPNLLNILALNEFDRGNVERAYEMGLEIARQYPKYATIYGMLGQIDSAKGQWESALKDGEHLVQLEPSAISYIAVATSLYQLKRYADVLDAVSHALTLEPKRIGNANGLTEGVYSLIILDRRSDARELLSRHMRANPKWRESEAMFRAALELELIKK